MKSLAVVCLLLSSLTSIAVTLPSVISSNMVLQQNNSVKLWGWGDPSEKVYITNTWNGKTDSTVVTGDAKWQVNVNTPAASGPYSITIKGNNTIVLQNILIGEVWICSGQSNMEYNYNWGLPQMNQEFPGAATLNIRFFHIPKTTAESAQEDCKAQWIICDSQNLKTFSAVAYYFGKKLNQDMNVPIGLIHASWGGTPAEVWTPAAAIISDSVLDTAAHKLSKSPWWPINPGYAYNAMLAPLTNYVVAGAIWYQGESNTGTASTYQKLLTAMITSWREKWKIAFPFYFVQLAPYKYGNKNIAALLREAQFKTLTVPKTGMVVTTDLAEDTLDIHPKNKRDVGFRLAKLALSGTYGKVIENAKSPFYNHMELVKDKALISFDNSEALVIKNNAVTGLYIAGGDQHFYPAQAVIKNNQLVAWSKNVQNPVAVRYAFSNTAVGNIFTKGGMPVAPFRTDNWNVDSSIDNTKLK